MLNICSDTLTASRSRTGKVRSADCISNGMQISLQNHSVPIKNPPSSNQYSETVTDWIINSLWYLTWISSNNLCPWKYILLPSLWSLTREQSRKFHPQPVLWYHTPHFGTVPFTDLPVLKVLIFASMPTKKLLQIKSLHDQEFYYSPDLVSLAPALPISFSLNYSWFSGTFWIGALILLLAFILLAVTASSAQPLLEKGTKMFIICFWSKAPVFWRFQSLHFGLKQPKISC